MNVYDGLGYYYDYLSLDRDNFLVQFNAGTLANYSGVNHPEFSRTPNFPQAISNASGLDSPTNRWTHFFVYNKTGSGAGVLFSNFAGNYPYSGYAIGLTDDNKVYFETYDDTGPVVKVGSRINGTHNAIAVAKNNSVVAFNYFNFYNQSVESESFAIQDQYVLPSNVAYLGGASTFPSYSEAPIFPGIMETYAYMTESFNPIDLETMFSGLYSYYGMSPGSITSYSYTEITGYQQVPYGYSGITGYQSVYGQIGTGKNGVPISGYSSAPLSGYITAGYNSIPLSGTTTIYQTGDPVYSLIVDSNFLTSFGMNSATILSPEISGELDSFYGAINTGAGLFNQMADYDALKKCYELNDIYNDVEVQIFFSGNALANLGHSTIGNIYNSSYQISGDYFLDGFDVMLKAKILNKNAPLIYDVIPSGQKMSINTFGHGSGYSENLGLSSYSIAFFNGSLLNYGYDYKRINNSFQWATNNYSGISGILSVFTPTASNFLVSGLDLSNLPSYQRGTSRVYSNGHRLTLNTDYVENSTLDFLKGRTILETGLRTIYNNDNNFFE